MSEKQASSEIAQSRERCAAWFNDNFEEQNPIGTFASWVWEVWQAAERDTRERCAQQGRSLLEIVLDVTLSDLSQKNEILDTFERRIRGKE